MTQLLVLNKPDRIMWKRGDIVATMPDGGSWGAKEIYPDFIRVTVPDADNLRLDMRDVEELSEILNPAAQANRGLMMRFANQPVRKAKLLKMRRYRVPPVLLDQHVDGYLTLTLEQLEDKHGT